VVGELDPVTVIEEDLQGGGSSVLLVVEIDGQVAGGIQYHEENDPMYRHAGIDIYLGSRFQGQGAGREAIGLLARFLFGQGGHHRLTIDPAPLTSRPSAATPQWVFALSASCASMSAAATAISTMAC